MAVRFFNGFIADTPTVASDAVRISVPNLTQMDRVVYGPLSWTPIIDSSGSIIFPSRGDACLIAVDDDNLGDQWIVSWSGSRSVLSQQPADAAKATVNGGSQAITTGNNAIVNLPSEDFDNNLMHDGAGPNPSRVLAKNASIYAVKAMVRFSAAVGGLVLLEILRNGATPGPAPSSTTNSQYLSFATDVRCVVDDYFEIKITNSSGATVTIANAWLSVIQITGQLG